MQQERYLWVHFVGLAAVPLLLDLCLAGLASASPAFDYPAAFGLQYWAIALIGVGPTLWMQIARPFYPFSLPPLAVKPAALEADQRRCLEVLTSWQIKALAGATALLCLWLLAQVYKLSPQITPLLTPIAGLITAAIAFLLVCLFLQISVSMARIILISPQTLKRVTPYEVNAIASNFLILGFPVPQILSAPYNPKSSTQDSAATTPQSESSTAPKRQAKAPSSQSLDDLASAQATPKEDLTEEPSAISQDPKSETVEPSAPIEDSSVPTTDAAAKPKQQENDTE